MEGFDRCPIEMALDYLRNKWTFEILRDLFLGTKTFGGFQESNKISKSVLNERLKELIKKGIIEKKIDENLKIEYQLTERGRGLNKIMYELVAFGIKHAESCTADESCSARTLRFFKRAFRIKKV
jgi:DNA-binding HxlR family transcriptional regulator